MTASDVRHASSSDLSTAMETVRDKMASRQHDLKLYLEHINPETKAEVRLKASGFCIQCVSTDTVSRGLLSGFEQTATSRR
jgi:hypothetical protein